MWMEAWMGGNGVATLHISLFCIIFVRRFRKESA